MDATPIEPEGTSPNPPASSGARVKFAPRLPHWLVKIAIGNPFYLFSAALLLYGIYRIAVDPKFLATETRQVIFNFSSLQVYEVLLVLTAVLLARRRIWADATLLVKLDALLVVAPFILISHAIVIGEGLGRILCLSGAALGIARMALLKRAFPNLHLPGPYLGAGLLILLLNAALPLMFRSGLEANLEAWRSKQFLLWIVVLPGLMALPNAFPRATESGAARIERSWQPFALYCFWILGTAVHLICIDYVDQVNYRKETALQAHLITPALWVFAWTLFFRLSDSYPAPGPRAARALLLLPILALLPSLWHYDSRFFWVLTTLNSILFAALYLKHGQSFALHLALCSFAAVLASSPLGSGRGIFPSFDRAEWIFCGIVFFVVLEGIVNRTAKFGIVSSAVVLLVSLMLSAELNYPPQLAVQIALVWLLIHSLRWNDPSEPQASTVRALACLVWAIHSWLWISEGTGGAFVPWLALLLSVVYGGLRWLGGGPAQILIPLAAISSVAPMTLRSATIQVKEIPIGLLALAASFLLFALGTAFALWRSGVTVKNFFKTRESPPREI